MIGLWTFLSSYKRLSHCVSLLPSFESKQSFRLPGLSGLPGRQEGEAATGRSVQSQQEGHSQPDGQEMKGEHF